MDFTFTPKIKRLIIIASCIAIIGLVGWLLYIFLNQATLTIVTKSNSDTISLFRSFPDRQPIDVKLTNGSATMRVPAGTYTATLLEGLDSAQQNVDLKAGDSKTITLNIQKHLGVIEPVSSMSSGFIAASKSKLRFIDRIGANGLYSIDESNRVQSTDTTYKYLSASWSDTSFGVAKVQTKKGDRLLVAVDGDTVKPVTLPFAPTASFSYAASSNHDIYISDGRTIYSGTVEDGFNKIYESTDQLTINAASNNAVLVSQQGPVSERTTGLVVLQKDGKKFHFPGEVYEAAWSPSGNRLVTSGDTSNVFDPSLKRITSLPQGNVNSPIWLDDDRIAYGISDKVWIYTLSTGRASAIASVGGTGLVSQLALSIDRDYLYVSMQKTDTRRDTQFRLLRVGLQGQQTLNPRVQQLSTLLPHTKGDCRIGYTNFVKTSITTSSSDCTSIARQFFSTYKVDLSGTDFHVTK